MQQNKWQLREAKSKLSYLINLIEKKQQPQIITKHDKAVAMLVPYQDYKRLTKHRQNLVVFLQKSPLANSKIKIDRDKSLPRDISL